MGAEPVVVPVVSSPACADADERLLRREDLALGEIPSPAYYYLIGAEPAGVICGGAYFRELSLRGYCSSVKVYPPALHRPVEAYSAGVIPPRGDTSENPFGGVSCGVAFLPRRTL